VFLDELRAVLEPGEQLLLGTGLVIDEPTLVAAYDDSAGVTAEFNRNVLHVLNRELAADFDVDAFAHVALWDPVDEWIEMRLRATRAMTVHVRAVGLVVEFAEGEEMRTEISAKFHVAGVRQMLQASAFAPVQTWTDPEERFALTLAAAVEGDEQVLG
jgi:L-histidine N-alpha-methyltransferase